MSQYTNHPELNALKLGKETDYAQQYDPKLLQAVPRRLNRETLGIAEQQPFSGYDIWHAYEVSWLNNKGKPVVALMRLAVNASTPNIVESKSLKLYLNSLNQTRFTNVSEVKNIIQKDINNIVAGEVDIQLYTPDDNNAFTSTTLPGDCIDTLDIQIDNYQLDAACLHVENHFISETLHSHLLKSNCLITNQPDWASVIIEYSGQQINREALLRYIISFREHNEFHEQCVERIFCDIQTYCKPDKLSVQALYTRRGGLDINPYRTSESNNNKPPIRRINRQ